MLPAGAVAAQIRRAASQDEVLRIGKDKKPCITPTEYDFPEISVNGKSKEVLRAAKPSSPVFTDIISEGKDNKTDLPVRDAGNFHFGRSKPLPYGATGSIRSLAGAIRESPP